MSCDICYTKKVLTLSAVRQCSRKAALVQTHAHDLRENLANHTQELFQERQDCRDIVCECVNSMRDGTGRDVTDIGIAIQGKDCLVAKFRNSSVMLEPPHYRPKVPGCCRPM